jgi:hypothetical protein
MTIIPTWMFHELLGVLAAFVIMTCVLGIYCGIVKERLRTSRRMLNSSHLSSPSLRPDIIAIAPITENRAPKANIMPTHILPPVVSVKCGKPTRKKIARLTTAADTINQIYSPVGFIKRVYKRLNGGSINKEKNHLTCSLLLLILVRHSIHPLLRLSTLLAAGEDCDR